ncbi:hypothetical protein FKM82_020067 [Ascaphus truei]
MPPITDSSAGEMPAAIFQNLEGEGACEKRPGQDPSENKCGGVMPVTPSDRPVTLSTEAVFGHILQGSCRAQ